MRPLDIAVAAVTGEPAFGLVPSLLLATLGLAMFAFIVIKLVAESNDEEHDRRPDADDAPGAPDPDPGSEAEHTSEDVV